MDPEEYKAILADLLARSRAASTEAEKQFWIDVRALYALAYTHPMRTSEVQRQQDRAGATRMIARQKFLQQQGLVPAYDFSEIEGYFGLSVAAAPDRGTQRIAAVAANDADPVAAAVAGSAPFEGNAGGLLADSSQVVVWLIVALAIGLLLKRLT